MKKILALTLVVAMTLSLTTVVSAKDKDQYMEEFGQLVDYILQGYSGDDVSLDEIFEGAFDGAMSPLDQYSKFYNKAEAKSFIDSLSSQYVGIGVRIQVVSDQVVITEVFEGGAAYDAGIRVNDVIYKVDGELASDYELNDLVDRIVGDVGSYVTIEFLRAGQSFSLKLERREVVIPTVKKMVFNEGDYGLDQETIDSIYGLKVSSFSSGTDEDFAIEVDKAIKAKADYLIVDLRDNGGGYLDTAVNMLKLVVPAGNIVTLTTKLGNNTTYYSELEKVPFQVLVLVNENSASASEIFAAAVQENGNGVIVGEQTFGKGVAQQIFGLGQDYLVKMTTQEFFSPNMSTINGIGVIPDIIIDTPEYVNSNRRFFPSDVDDQIVNVEGMLTYLGYFDEEPDDTYTNATYRAIWAFQRDTGLYPYGVCDYTTQARLNLEYMNSIADDDPQLKGVINWIQAKSKKE